MAANKSQRAFAKSCSPAGRYDNFKKTSCSRACSFTFIAAHPQTERAALQTADIARRLMRGGELHRETAAS
jgi:hypothetical protein